MRDITFTCTVNAGLAIECDGFRLVVDPFPVEKTDGFSAMTPSMLETVLCAPAFQKPDILFFTHRHGDHYSASAAQRLLRRWPNTRVVMPACSFSGGIDLAGDTVLQCGGAQLRFIRLPHQGDQFADVPHYGLIATLGGRNVLLTGDCLVAAPVLAEKLSDTDIETAVFTFPWITLKRGIAFVDRVVRPSHIIVNHLPLPADDCYGYARCTARYAAAVQCTADIRMMDYVLKSVRL